MIGKAFRLRSILPIPYTAFQLRDSLQHSLQSHFRKHARRLQLDEVGNAYIHYTAQKGNTSALIQLHAAHADCRGRAAAVSQRGAACLSAALASAACQQPCRFPKV